MALRFHINGIGGPGSQWRFYSNDNKGHPSIFSSSSPHLLAPCNGKEATQACKFLEGFLTSISRTMYHLGNDSLEA